MASVATASILPTIDKILERASEVKMCQDHTELIATTLTRLRQRLTISDKTYSQGNLEDTLKTIDEIITNCVDNENRYKRMTWKDLETALLHLQYRLAQYECTLVDDCETRVQILSNALEKQRLCVLKSSDEIWKQRLETLEQQTKQNVAEKHCYLREKYSQTIESYLQACIELHQWVSISDLTSDAVTRLTKPLYQEQMILENKWRSYKLPIKKPFAQFKAAKFIEEEMNEEQLIRNRRWNVVLGEPGSGKTSFAQWLVYYLAQTLLKKEYYSTNYGPVRIPIFISIKEFAERWQEEPSLTLFDYIGKLSNSSIISSTLQDYIQQGLALVILDGFDEISTFDQGSKMIGIIENFLDKYVQISSEYSSFDEPFRSEGNQLIIMCRTGSLYTTIFTEKFSCCTIQPLDKKSIMDFVDYCFSHMHEFIIGTLNSSLPTKLKNELETTQNTDLLEMASNPRLLSYICTICFSRALPAQRFLQYDSIIKTMLRDWSRKISTVDISQVIRILTDITSYIYHNSTSNLIHYDQIKEICLQTIKSSTNHFERQVSEMIHIICHHLGILTLREPSHYAFLHRAFEDYFICLRLVEFKTSEKQKFVVDELNLEKKIRFVIQMLNRHISDHRFRIPITLALEKISSSWSQGSFDDFCYEFIQNPHEYDPIIPFHCYILINSIEHFVKYPANEILFSALDRLMIAAGQHQWFILCPFLFNQITNTLRKFPNETISLWINQFLSTHSSHQIETITAFCQFLQSKSDEFDNIEWLDETSCSTLQSLLIFDNISNGFSIDRLLLRISFSKHQLLPVYPKTLKYYLLHDQIEMKSIPVVLLPLIIILYGGLTRDGENLLFNPSCIHRESSILTPILIRLFSTIDYDKQDQHLQIFQQECLKLFVMRIEKNDESLETIDLCIAVICLFNIEYIQNNLNIMSNSFLSICLNRFKYVSMILRQFYFPVNENDLIIENQTTEFLSIIIEKFQSVRTRFYFLHLLDTLKSSVARLRSSSISLFFNDLSKPDQRLTLYLPNSLRNENQFLTNLLITDTQLQSNETSCSLIHHFRKLFSLLEHNNRFHTSDRMSIALNTIPEYLLFRNDEDIFTSLTFVPSHLQNLFIRLLKENLIVINPKDPMMNNKKQHLYFGHILTECLIFLSNASCKRLSRLNGLINLLPWLRMQYLENFGSSLLWSLAVDDSILLDIYERKRRYPTNYQTGKYMDEDHYLFKGSYLKDQQLKTIIQNSIQQEYQRLENALKTDDRKCLKLYSASISLAFISHWTDNEKSKLDCLEKSINGAMLIENELVRLDALSIIALFSFSNYDQIRINENRSLKTEIEDQFHQIYPNLSLLLQTTILIRCLPLISNSQLIDHCLENLFNKFNDTDQRDRQAVIQALFPYLQFNQTFSFLNNRFSYSLEDRNRNMYPKSSTLKKYFDMSTSDHLCYSLTISSLYLVELTNDFQSVLQEDNRQSKINSSIETKLFPIGNNILREEQVLIITDVLSSIFSTNEYEKHKELIISIHHGLKRLVWVEFKSFHLLETWFQWINSNELSIFANHAALLLINSDRWSIQSVMLFCDLLCNENDYFRQKAEMICHSLNEDDVRTSSKLGIDVLLILIKKKISYESNSPAIGLKLNRFIRSITIDIQYHLETLLWLERYRIHALNNKEFSLNNFQSFFTNDIELNTSSYINSFRLSTDLILYLCDLIESNFSKFLSINEDSTSNEVLKSHTQFVVSVLFNLYKLLNNNDQTRQRAMVSLMKLFEKSVDNEICQSISYLLAYVSYEKTYKKIFNKIVWISNRLCYGTSHYSIDILCSLISSYFYCISVNKIALDEDDLNFFPTLLRHESEIIVKSVATGLARVISDGSSLIEYFNGNSIECYHALIGATASWYIDEIQQMNENKVVKFIEQHPNLLAIFMVELYDSMANFSCKMQHNLAFGYPTYVKIGSLIALRMPSIFCTFVNDWFNGDSFKRMLSHMSKQNHFPQRAACLTILCILGELTVELCEMFMESVYDNPYIQNNSYQSIRHLRSIKDEKVVLNHLSSYLKSKSMSVRYMIVKILLHLSSSSLVAFEEVRIMLNDVMLDSTSNEDLWIIKAHDNYSFECQYYNIGPLKDVIYSLLVRYITRQTSDDIRTKQVNDIDLDFIESEKAARFSSCTYETKSEDIPK